MYIESSSPRKKGDNAMIGSAVFKPTSTCQLRFFYHMFGRHIGTLNVYTRTSTTGSMSKIWTKSADQGDNWVKATVSISVSQNFQVSKCVLFICLGLVLTCRHHNPFRRSVFHYLPTFSVTSLREKLREHVSVRATYIYATQTVTCIFI